MTRYTSGDKLNLKIGIESYSENLTSLEVIGTAEIDGDINVSAGNSITAPEYYGDGSNLTGLSAGQVGAITDLVSDTTPELGGDLDLNGFDIIETGNINITGVITATSFSGDLTGTATTATKLETSRNFSVSGDVATTSAVSFDGTANVDLAVTLSNNFSANTSGIITAFKFSGGDINVSAGNSITAPKYYGDGSNLTNLTPGQVGALAGVTIREEGTLEGSAGSVGDINFVGNYMTATASGAGATITLSDITLGTDTIGNYVATISGTANEIEVTNGSSAGSNPTIGLPNNVTISNDLSVSGNLNVTGTLTYEDVTNVDSIGIVTARSGIDAEGDINVSAGNSITAPKYYGDGSGLTGLSAGQVGAMTDLVSDTSPQLGGDLDLNNFDITGNGNINITGVITATSTVHIGSNENTDIALQADGNVRVGFSTTSNYIAFHGTWWDGTSSPGVQQVASRVPYTHTYVGERIYNYPEDAELLLYKGNDNHSQFGTDRIRYLSGMHEFQLINDDDTVGTFEEVGNFAGITTALLIDGIGETGVSTVTVFGDFVVNGDFESDINVSAGNSITAPKYYGDGSGLTGLSAGQVGAMTDLVSDTSPQLGGDLDLNGFDITETGNINITGVVTATSFDGSLATSDLSGTITNAQLAGSIANSKLVNSSVSYGGVPLSLGGSDATPAFDLRDATNYPYGSLTGTPTIPADTGDLTNNAGFITSSDSITGTASTATTVTISSNNDSTAYRVPYTSSTSGNVSLYVDNSDGMTYNPGTNTLFAGFFSGNGSNLTNVDADTLDGIDSTGFLQTFYETAINSPDASGGTWTTNSNSSSWGDPKFNNSFDQTRYADGSSAYVQYNIPSGYKSCWISQLQWSSGGYADCYGVQSDGGLVFLRRINTRQLVENTNEGNPDQHDGMTITHIGSGLEHYTAIKIQNQSGRIHLTGIAWTKNENVGYEGTGMVHPAQISHQGSGSGLNADLLDSQNGSYYLDYANFTGTPTIPTNNNQLTNGAGYITSSGSITGNAATATRLQTARSIGGTSFNGSADITPFRVNTIATVDGGTLRSSYTTYAARNTASVPNNYGYGVNWEFKNASVVSGNGNYAGLLTLAPWVSTTASTGDPSYQLAFSPAAANSTNAPTLKLRAGIDTTWGGWSTIYHSGNDGSNSGLDADLLDGQEGSFYRNASNLNAGTIPDALITDIGDSQARIITFDNLEKSNLTSDGQLGFDSSQGLLVYRTQQGTSGSTTTVLDGWNVAAGTNISITNLGSGDTGTGEFTFSVTQGSGSGLDADLLDGAQPSVNASNSTIVQRHSSGYIYANYFNTTPNDVSSGVTRICCETGNDGFIRHATADAVRAFIDDGRYLSSNANDTATGSYLFNRNNAAITNGSYAQGNNHIELRTTNASNPILGFHRSGYTATALYHSGYGSGSLRMRNADGNDGPIFSTFNDGAGSGLDADLLDGLNLQTGAATANTVAGRNGSGDIFARLIRQTYADQSTISGGMVFRVNNSTDNYLRVCSSTSAIRTFLNVPTRTGGDASGTWGININGNAATVSVTSITSGATERPVYFNDGTTTSGNGVLRMDGSANGMRYRADQNRLLLSNLTVANAVTGDLNGNASTATLATLASTVTVSSTNVNSNHRVAITEGTGSKAILSDGQLLYNPNTDVLTSGTLHLGGSQILSSAAKLQVNGFMRTGNIVLHEGGNTPTATAARVISNTSGTLQWEGSTVWTAGNDGSGSGLDADTIDGTQLSSLMTLSGTETVTGAKTFNNNVRLNFGTTSSHSLRRDATNLILDIPNGGTFFIRDTSGTASIKHSFSSNGNYNSNGVISGNGSGITNVAAASVQVNNSTDQTVYALFANNNTAEQKTPLMTSLISANLNNGRLNTGSFKATDLIGTGTRDIYANSSGVLVISSSDERLKTNINPITTQYDIIKQLNPVTFNWIDTENLGSQEEVGFIAQQMQTHVPQVIGTNNDGTLTIDYAKLTSVLTKALQESIAKIESLEARLDAAGL